MLFIPGTYGALVFIYEDQADAGVVENQDSTDQDSVQPENRFQFENHVQPENGQVARDDHPAPGNPVPGNPVPANPVAARGGNSPGVHISTVTPWGTFNIHLNHVTSLTPPPKYVCLKSGSAVVPGMPVLVYRLGGLEQEWDAAEVLAVDPTGQAARIRRFEESDRVARRQLDVVPLELLAAEPGALDRAEHAPETFASSVPLLPGCSVPLESDEVPLPVDLALVPGTPMRSVEDARRLVPVVLLAEGKDGMLICQNLSRWLVARPRSSFSITKKVIEELGDAEEAAAKYADGLKSALAWPDKGHVRPDRRKVVSHSLGDRLPDGFEQLNVTAPVNAATELRTKEGPKWYDLTVVFEQPSGELMVYWNDYGFEKFSLISRNSVVVRSKDQSAGER